MVAELSGNHGGQLETALALLEAAAAAGADAVKIQSYTPDTITLEHDGPGFRIEKGLWRGQTLHQLYQRAHTPWDWHPHLFERAQALGIPLFSSPFDETAVDMLEDLGCPAYKIASFELVDVGLIRAAARTGKPLIMSTGMATLGEIEEAVAAARSVGSGPIILLHCTSAYPTPVAAANLRTLPVLRDCFQLPVGLSDHTQSASVALAAVALGACLVEKHIMLATVQDTVDAAFSLPPDAFRQTAQGCREVALALGQVTFGVSEAEQAHAANRRSLYAVQDIPRGGIISADNVRSVRPGHGLHPREMAVIIGMQAKRLITKGTPIHWTLLENAPDPNTVGQAST